MSRILIPFDTGELAVPDAPVLYLNAQPGPAISAFPEIVCVQDSFPIMSLLPTGSLSDSKALTETFATILIDIARDRDQNRAMIAMAWDHANPGATIVVSGAKTDGIDALSKEVKSHFGRDGTLAKSHGKTFWLTRTATTPPVIETWRSLADLAENPDGFLTAPGMFSHAKVDRASRILAENLPRKLGAHVIDLGAGWGYLSGQALKNDAVARLELVEASAASLAAANANIDDPRAQFHWADARHFAPDTPADTVIMNPPFHVSRSAEPSLGKAFIMAAAKCLKPSGSLWMVANRHLPYEASLQSCFRHAEIIRDQDGFKILMGRNPLRTSP